MASTVLSTEVAMTITNLYRVAVSARPPVAPCRIQRRAVLPRATRLVNEPFDFAVGFSRQPLPKGNRFAIVTNTDGPGIKATDATIRYGLDLTILRPETIESLRAKLPPTANFFEAVATSLRDDDVAGGLSIAERARVGFEQITNGVKQKLPGMRLLGLDFRQANHSSHPTRG